jgi:hypothetical protein
VDFNKQHSETRKTIKKKYKIKKITQDMKREFNKDTKNLTTKNQTEILEIKSPFTQIKNVEEGQSSRLEQGEDRISGLKDKIDFKKQKN